MPRNKRRRIRQRSTARVGVVQSARPGKGHRLLVWHPQAQGHHYEFRRLSEGLEFPEP